ncbi:NADP-dependent malic enzyme isoform X4 [Eurytemora carolleeae]|uniref:NADP-dependent malic enzyme isoform X4 n=1 Tax=Eurytemora carolleeae TaxID=1294199 RepID=UPI000C775C20|nr:NADP-dependent malic enzyme isoform X4 [Eurytemora carolleeae]|eukprot:XP_023327514.1 NADP-dependent malic enzyme-like isoform X4 [Eurytemora affinis]
MLGFKQFAVLVVINSLSTIVTVIFVTKYCERNSGLGSTSSVYSNNLENKGSRSTMFSPSRRGKSGGSVSDVVPNQVAGVDYLRDPHLFKGMAFTLEERQTLGIHGLLPPRIKNMDEQADNSLRNMRRFQDPLNQYMYLVDLLERNERLFYKLLSENIEELMPVVYTPTVGLACQKFGLAFKRPMGLFITIHDKGHVKDVIKNWPESDVRAIVVTDGERILGLGDLGAQGMGIPVGKLALYTALAGIPPQQCLPITLDVGTNRQELLDDVDYIGLRHKRVTGPEYDEFIDEFMQAVVERYGQNTLIQFEDFGNSNAFRFLEKYRNSYCTFNDDIQGTASVAVAGILAALKATNTKLQDHTFLFQGAGEAAIGIANLIAMAMEKREGVPREEALKRIWLKDSRGLIVKDRPEGGISSHKADFAHPHKTMTDLGDIVRELKPTVLIGAAAIPKVFTPEIIRDMATFNKAPIIFALSNPTSKAECTAEEAYANSDGRAVFASGSPFPVYEGFGKRYEPGQGNNAYIFPGAGLGVLATGIYHISDSVFLSAAEALAEMVEESDIEVGRLYPPLSKIREISLRIATRIAEEAYAEGTASTYPEPKDKAEYIKQTLYNYNYDDARALPTLYSWPDHKKVKFGNF